MVQVAFFLRFKPQLQRIRPELIRRLDDTVVRAVKEAGGKLTGEHSLMRAVFNENSLGFWLDILLLIETITNVLEKAASDLYGYSLLVGKVLPEIPNVYRFLAGGKGGVFLDKTAVEAMRPYVTIEEQGKWAAIIQKYNTGPFSRLNEVKIFVSTARLDFPSLRRANTGLPDTEQRPAALIAGQSFEGKRDKLYFRVAGFTPSADVGAFSPLFVRFGNGGVNSLTDSWAGWMHSPSPGEDIYADWEFLFRQRLRDKPSAFIIRTARRFFKRLLNRYRSMAQAEGKTPVIVLENIQNAERAAADIVKESLREWRDILLLGTCTGEFADTVKAEWRSLFPQLTGINGEEASNQNLPDLPFDLWEIGYAYVLLGRYFPPDMIPQLLEEAGKSPSMISRAVSLLYTLRVVDTPLDPRPWHRHFQYRAETVLEERKDRIQAMVRKLLLAWVAKRKIYPCLRLLEILKELGGTEDIDDNLILQSIYGELAGCDESAFENIRYVWIPEVVAGPARAPVLRSILETLSALHSGNAQKIHTAFASSPPDFSTFPLLKTQVLLNRSLYYVSLRDVDSATEAVKESSLLCQKGGGIHLAQVYRLFALTSLLRRRIGETIDYLGFSLENAAKSGNFQDIGMAAFYAASVQLLYGNLSRAMALAEKARRHFLKAGNPEWADRSRFLSGRIAFEVGSYRQAVDLFEDIRQNPEGARIPEKNDLLETWACRAQVCCQPSRSLQLQDKGRDTDLFRVEALCLAGDYAATVKLSDTFIAGLPAKRPPGEDDLLYTERPDWRSGFTQCESLCFSWDDLHSRIMYAYQSIAQSALSPDKSEDSIRTMQRVLRGNQSPDIDPHNVFFHYAWYRVLRQAGSSQVDISTAVSVAFKRLQSRASLIDDADTRLQYLTQPLWNKALAQAAKELKLV